jgi:OOP family OmpA-OmpF porin
MNMRMRRTRLVTLAMIFATVLLGLNATNVAAAEVMTQKELVRTADNFVILFDASGSMDAVYGKTGKRRVEVAKEILQQRNQMLPELGWNAGLYLFTPSRPLYDMKPYNRAEFGKAIDQLTTTTRVPPSRTKMMQELDDLLSRLSGQTAVFLFTDGNFVAPIKAETSPVMMAKELVAKHDVCLYVISSAKTPKQKANVEGVAAANTCSRVISFEALLNRPEYTTGALYMVKDVAIVETELVSKTVGVELNNILFDFNSADIRPEYHDELDTLAKYLEKNPDAYVVIEGFTDSTGDPIYNLDLSRRRAESVKTHLMQNYTYLAGEALVPNIAEQRLVTVWYGKDLPVASNETAEGRQLNRRVRITIKRTD